MDKALLWGQRSAALASVAVPMHPSDYLMVVSDAIDQGHWRLPRDPGLKSIKSLASYHRPTSIVVCVWVIGVLCRFWVLDEDQMHDSSTTADLVARTLEEVKVIFTTEGKQMPPNVVYWVLPCSIMCPVFAFDMFAAHVCSVFVHVSFGSWFGRWFVESPARAIARFAKAKTNSSSSIGSN